MGVGNRILRLSAVAFALALVPPQMALAWWNTSWGLRRKITFNNSGQASNLVDLPVLIRLDSNRVEYFRTQNLGQDIRFVAANDVTLLDHEIELWDEAGSSYVWVRVPQVNGASTTDHIWMYYDNPIALDGQNAAGVWSNGYRGVWHLKEDPAGAPPQMKDSANTNHGTALNSPVPAAGQIDGSLSFDGTMDRNVDVPNNASLQLPTDMTVSSWIRTTNPDPDPPQARLVVAKWNATGRNYWLGKLDASTFNFIVDNGQGVSISLGLVNDGPWHHVVGVADASAGLLRLYVDGTQQATAAYTGTSQTGTSVLQIGNNPDSTLQNWDGGLDEVRVAGVARSADWIRAQYLSTTDTFATYGPTACFSGCQALTVTDSGSVITVTSANAFELVFSDAAGGHVDRFFDLDEDPTRMLDLAGGLAAQDGLFLDEIGWLVDTNDYRSDKSSNGGRGAGRLLEFTSTRVLVRSESYFGMPSGASILPGVKGYGDWSVYASGRLALNWKRVTTSAVDTTFDQLHLNLNRPAAGPLSAWAGFTQSGPLCFGAGCTNPPTDHFVMVQNETAGAPGVRTDFLKIQYSDWSGATSTWGGESLGNEWVEASWMRSAPLTLPADTTETWNFLTHFKPTVFTSHTDPAVTSRSADYRTPDNLALPSAPVAGGGWFDAAENTTSPSDFFNEKEAAYALNLDPVAGLNVDLDGGTTTRYHPFFKIRQWRSLAAPNTITLEGVTLTRNVDFRADLMPISRSSFHRNLLWRSSLQSLAAITSPDVGSGGSVTGTVIYGPTRFGDGARLNASGDSIQVPTTGGNFDAAQGVLGFWYRPSYDSTDGVLHDICGFFVDANNYWFFEKRGAADGNELWFRINAGGALSTYRITAANYAWRANEWVHLTLDWDDGAALGGQQRVEINDVQPSHIDSGVDYNSAALTVAAQFRFGNADGDATFAPGDYDEIEIVRTHPLLAAGGLIGDTSEFLADPAPAQNFTLNFQPVDASRRGRYLHFGATSKFRGLNVALATPGVGVPAGALEWEYWNGTAWSSLEAGCPGACVYGFTDTTSSFTRTGNVYWTDPPDWAPFSVFGGVDIFRIRVHLAAGSSYSTFPVEGVVKTDVLLLQYCGDVTLDAQTFVIGAPVPTAVELESFSATGRDSAVDLSWTTASELSNLGFHLYRAESSEGPYTRITSSLIPGLGSSATGQSYSYRDSGLVNGRTYHYLLEDIETTGRTERHGPVSATPSTTPGGSDTPPGPTDGVGTSYGDPSSVVLREVERSARHVVLELLTGGFTASPAEGGRVRLRIPGFESASRPGEPSLPMRRTLVEAASGKKVRVASIVASDVLRFPGLRPVSQGMPGIEVSEEGSVLPSEEKSREGSSFKGLFPAESALLLGASFQRETKKAELLLFPLRWDGNGLELSRRLLVRLEFAGSEGQETSRGGSRGRRRVERASHLRKGVVAQMVVKEKGLYRVDYEDLFETGPGPQPRGLSASSLRLSRQGEGVAFHVEPPGALFGPGSSLFFLSEGASLNPYADAAYELETNTSGLLMGEESLSPTTARRVGEYSETLLKEENHYYQAGLLEAPDLWLWDIVVSPGSKSYGFTVSELASSSSMGRLSVVLQGASDFEGVLDHHVRVGMNGTLLGETTWDGMVPETVEVEVPPGVLHEGANSLEIEDVGDAGAAYSMVFLNRFSVSYPRRLVARQGTLEGRFESSGPAEIEGASASSFVLDTTDVPQWLEGAGATPNGLSLPVRAGRSYLVTSTSLRPEVKRLEASGLRNVTNRADYLLLGPQAFLPAAQPLLDLRESQGLVTKAVSLEEIYEQFGHGEVSPEAIKEFLEYAYHFWAAPSPRYVLLLGDASYDPKDYLQTGVKDWIPGFPVRTSYLWTVSDPAYASVNGDDLLPDLAIGRLPAGSVDEAQRLVQKVLAFENGGGNFDGPAVLVADNADLAGNFEADADEIASTVLLSRNPRKIYYSQLGGATRAAILDAFDEGASLMSYVGHGSTVQWASEQFFKSQDVSTLAPQPQQPLLMTMNCLNGFFHFPPMNSLSEELLKAESKGVIGAFSPSGLSVNDPAHLFHKALLEEIVSGRHERIGDAVLAAQERYAISGAFPELLSIYHLLGDPALRLR